MQEWGDRASGNLSVSIPHFHTHEYKHALIRNNDLNFIEFLRRIKGDQSVNYVCSFFFKDQLFVHLFQGSAWTPKNALGGVPINITEAPHQVRFSLHCCTGLTTRWKWLCYLDKTFIWHQQTRTLVAIILIVTATIIIIVMVTIQSLQLKKSQKQFWFPAASVNNCFV